MRSVEFAHTLQELRDIAASRGIRSLEGVKVHCGSCAMPFAGIGVLGPGLYHLGFDERCEDPAFIVFLKDGREVGKRHSSITGGLLAMVVHPHDEPIDTHPFLNLRKSQ
jgi:hypothetical protein